MTKADPPCNACARGSHANCVGFGCPCTDSSHPPKPKPKPYVDPEELPPPRRRSASHWHDRLAGYHTDGDAICEAVQALLEGILKELTPRA